MAWLQKTPTSASEVAYGSGNERGLVGYSTDTGSASQNAANRASNERLSSTAHNSLGGSASHRSETSISNDIADSLKNTQGYLAGKKAYQSYLNNLINDTVNAGGRFENGTLTDQFGNTVDTNYDYSAKNYNNTFGINDLADANYGNYGTYSTASRGIKATNEDVQNSQSLGLAEQNAQQEAEANKIAGTNSGVSNAAASNVANNTANTASNTYANSLGGMASQNAATQADYLNKMGQVQSAQQKAQNLQNSAALNTIGGALQGAGTGASIGAGISDERCKQAADEDLNGTGFEPGDPEYDNHLQNIHNLYTDTGSINKKDQYYDDIKRRTGMLNSNTPANFNKTMMSQPYGLLGAKMALKGQMSKEDRAKAEAAKAMAQAKAQAMKFNAANMNKQISDENMKKEPSDDDIMNAVNKFFELYKQVKELREANKGDK